VHIGITHTRVSAHASLLLIHQAPQYFLCIEIRNRDRRNRIIDMMVRANKPSRNGDEEEWQRALRRLQQLMKLYEEARKRDDTESATALAQMITEVMQRLADIHPDPRVQEEWRARAEAFSAAGDSNEGDGVRDHILADIGVGLLILLATPFALAGAALFAAGGIIYGAGSVVMGVGNLLTLGAFKQKK